MQYITHNNQQLKQLMSSTQFGNNVVISESEQCRMCQNETPPFHALISHSLFGKYASSQNFYYTKDIEDILNEQLCHTFIEFQENNYLDDDQQYLRRQYGTEQFPKKIEMLCEYYKFHRDQPVWNDRGTQPIMAKYYNKVKDVDYKRIKSVLKKQQNISITTHKSFSSYDDSEFTKKSRYSTMLNELNTVSNQSVLLLEICDKIGKALKKVKPEPFKGHYYSGEKKFEDFLKKQKKRREMASKKQQIGKQSFGLKKFKFNQKLQTKNDQNGRQSKFVSNHPLHTRNPFKHKQLSIQKTAANDTASREEKSRREKSARNLNPRSSRGSLSKKSLRQNFISEITPPTYKQLSTINLANMGNSHNLKTINEIYQATSSRIQINGDSKKNVRPVSGNNKLKHRSNSSHNLCIKRLGSQIENTNNKVCGNKLQRTTSTKKIATSTTKISNINLLNPVSSTEKLGLKGREISQKMIRTNSITKINSSHTKPNDSSVTSRKSKKKTIPDSTERRSQKNYSDKAIKSHRNSVIENMLEKKLELFKKKQGFA